MNEPKFEKMIELGARMTPIRSVTVTCLGPRRRVRLSCGGGMGGAQWMWVGLLKPDIDSVAFGADLKFLELTLTEDKETHIIGTRWIVDIQPVNLWKYTEDHDNEHYKRPWVTYFTAPAHIGFRAVQTFMHDLDKVIERHGVYTNGC